MNGFVIFSSQSELERFTQEFAIALIRSHSSWDASSREPVLTFRDVSLEEFITVQKFALQHGGRVQEARQYASFSL